MRLSTKFFTLIFFAALAVLPACKKDPAPVINQPLTATYSGKVVRDWNAMFLQIERFAQGYRPAPATRALAYLGLSAYESCVPGMPNFKSMAGQCPGLQLPPLKENTILHYPTVVNASYAYLMQRFFTSANDVATITALETANNSIYQSEIGSSEFSQAQNYGRAVAAAVWEWSKTDAYGHNAYLDPFGDYDWSARYMGSGNWVPTFPGDGKAWFPHWGQVRTFVIQAADKLCSPPGPDSLYLAQGHEIVQATQNLTAYQRWMTEFWRDDFTGLSFSAGPRWIAIANQIYEKEGSDLEKTLYCNAKLGFALHDATVACWFSKYYYNRERPVTFIRREADPDWQPLLSNPLNGETGISPSYPSYPSDNATLAGAAAAVLTNIFGESYAMTDKSHDSAGIQPGSFNSFAQMASEDAASRMLNGVNFRMDTEQGLLLGRHCADNVNALRWKN